MESDLGRRVGFVVLMVAIGALTDATLEAAPGPGPPNCDRECREDAGPFTEGKAAGGKCHRYSAKTCETCNGANVDPIKGYWCESTGTPKGPSCNVAYGNPDPPRLPIQITRFAITNAPGMDPCVPYCAAAAPGFSSGYKAGAADVNPGIPTVKMECGPAQ